MKKKVLKTIFNNFVTDIVLFFRISLSVLRTPKKLNIDKKKVYKQFNYYFIFTAYKHFF